MDYELVTVATFRFLPEAEVSKLHLEAEGLTPFLADAETVSTDWFLGNAVGNIKLQVPNSQAATATALLEKVRNTDRGQSKLPEDVEGNVCLSCGAALPEEQSRCAACGWSYADGQDSYEPG